MKASYFLGIICFSLLLGCSTNVKGDRKIASELQGPQTDTESEWNDWVLQNSSHIKTIDPVENTDDLKPLLKIIGNASVVGLGESGHGLHDIPQFRNRLFQYLVKKKGFRAITLESGVLEAQIVEKYIQGEAGVTLKDALKDGITHGMGLVEESRDLVVWMKNYNDAQKDPSKKLHFFGFDLPLVGDAPVLPLQEMSPFIKNLDPKYHATGFTKLLELSEKAYAVTKVVRQKTRDYMKKKYPNIDITTVEIDPDDLDAYGTIGFEQLTKDEQANLENGIKSLISFLKNSKVSSKLKQSSQYQWNIHLAEIAGQHLRNLRSRQSYQKVFKYSYCIETMKKFGLDKDLIIDHSFDADMTNLKDILAVLKGRETREIMAAENVIWAQKRFGKALVYAHTGHLLKTAVNVHVGDIEVGEEGGVGQGMFMYDHYKKDYVMITGEVGTMTDLNGVPEETEGGIPWESVLTCNGCMGKAFEMTTNNSPLVLADLRNVDGGAASWLNEERAIRWQAGFQGVKALKGMDAFLYFRTNKPMFKIKL